LKNPISCNFGTKGFFAPQIKREEWQVKYIHLF